MLAKKKLALIIATIGVAMLAVGLALLCHEPQRSVQVIYYFEYADGPGIDAMLQPPEPYLPPGATPRELLARATLDTSAMKDAQVMRSRKYTFALQNAGEKLVGWCRSVQTSSNNPDPFAPPRYFQTPGWIDRLSRRDGLSKPKEISGKELDIPLRRGDVLILVRKE